MLELRDISAGYGPVQVLHGLSLTARPGEIHCIMGRNGAGKTTAMRAIMGLVTTTGGAVTLNGADLTALPAHRVPQQGVGYIPQGRRLFADLSVAENLQIGLMTRGKGAATRARVLDLFPRLGERLNQRAGTLSGGEQQMLATARALCLEPEVLLLDEPTEGLQPSMIALIRDAITTMKSEGAAVVLVEQRVEAVLAIADRVTFVENGRSAETVLASALEKKDARFARYVGV